MTRVLLGHSYFLRFDPKLWRAMQPYPPLGTLYAAAALRARGHEVTFFDAMLADSTREWEAKLESVRPEVAVLFEDNFNYLSKMCLLKMRDAAFEMTAAARERGITTIVAGADVTDRAGDFLTHGADFALIGEGEETLVDLLDALARGNGSDDIAGLAFVDADGGVRSNGRRPLIGDIDALPLPARDLIDIERYRGAWRTHGRFSMNIVTSRGCPFRCNWCAKPIWGQRYSVRSPAAVAEEVAMLAAMGAGHLWFMDDILGLKQGWLAEFAANLEATGIRIPFKCLARADLLLRAGEIEALKRAGCETVWLGAESGSQRVLDAMEKGTTVEQIKEARRRLGEAGIGVAFFLQFGYPGESWEDIQATLQLVRDCQPDDIGVSVSYPLPGTPFFERVRGEIKGRQNWVDSDDMAMLYRGPYSTDFYHRLYAAVHAEFRLMKAGRRPGRAVLGSLVRGNHRRALGLTRDALALPLLRARLERARRRESPASLELPVVLDREEAAAASHPSEEQVAAGAGRRR
jgi:anaerobic magnesium-protoporphyrin IX monomethyl ester cyclase